jgi:hypothetical protein
MAVPAAEGKILADCDVTGRGVRLVKKRRSEQ